MTMSVFPIVKYGDPVLNRAAAPVERFDDELRELVENMVRTMYAAPGVGLAAPQVYVPLRLLLAGGEFDEEGRQNLRVLINPEITVLDESCHEGMYEGCLSIPGLRGHTSRFRPAPQRRRQIAGHSR